MKRPLWPWIVATVIAVPVLYIASFGPACWLMSRTVDQALPDAYLPMGWLILNSPQVITNSLVVYAEIGITPGSHIYVPDSSISVIEIP